MEFFQFALLTDKLIKYFRMDFILFWFIFYIVVFQSLFPANFIVIKTFICDANIFPLAGS